MKKIENISTLKIQKLTKDQFQNGLENNILDDTSIYLTPVEIKDYALKSDLNTKADLIDNKIPEEQIPDIYLPKEMAGSPNGVATLDAEGKVPAEQIPEDIVDLSDYYTKTEVDEEIDLTKEGFNTELTLKADLVDGKVPANQLPEIPSSWNDLTDKPFGETTGLKYEWDGETSNKEHLSVVDGFDFYHISSDILTDDELIGATIKTYFDGELIENEISRDGNIIPVQTANGNLVVIYGGQLPVCFIASQTGEDSFKGITFFTPLTGIWFFHGPVEEEYTHYLQKDAEIKKIDKKFLPDDIGGGASSWNDLTDRPFYDGTILIELPASISEDNTIISQSLEDLDGMKFSFVKYNEAFATPEETYGGLIKLNYVGEVVEFIINDSYLKTLNNGFALIVSSDTGFFPLVINANSPGTAILPTADMLGEDLIFEVTKPGAYFLYMEGLGNVISYSNTVLKQLDDKFIPDNILRTDGSGGLILSWDEVTNKPFGEEKKFEDIIWNGSTEGLLPSNSVDINAGEAGTITTSFYKVSDMVLSLSDMIGAKVLTIYPDSEEETYIDDNYASENLVEFNSNGSFVDFNDLGFVCVTEDNTSLDVSEMSGVPGTVFVFPKAGVWFVRMLRNGSTLLQYTSSLTNSIIKQINTKFLPINTPNGVAGLDENGKLLNEQLKIAYNVDAYIDDPVSSGAVYDAIQNIKVTTDSFVTSGSNNPVSSNAVYNALQNIDLSSKQDKISVSHLDEGKFMRVVDGTWAAVSVPHVEEVLF